MFDTYALISEQVNRDQINTIMRELDRTLANTADGAIVEFGCYSGTTSLFIRRLLDTRQDAREFHAYDSFEGLPAKASQDVSGAGEQFIAGELAVSKKDFIQEFKKANLTLPTIHKGWFNDLTSKDVPPKIAFAFLDGDFYDSIADSLRLVLPNLAEHATIIFDDYAHEALPGVERAVRDFAPHLTKTIRVQHNLGIVRL